MALGLVMVAVVEQFACDAKLRRLMIEPRWLPLQPVAAAAVIAAAVDGVSLAVAVSACAQRAVQGTMEYAPVVAAELERVVAPRPAVPELQVVLLGQRDLRPHLAPLASLRTDRDHEWSELSAFRRDAGGLQLLLSTSPSRSRASARGCWRSLHGKHSWQLLLERQGLLLWRH